MEEIKVVTSFNILDIPKSFGHLEITRVRLSQSEVYILGSYNYNRITNYVTSPAMCYELENYLGVTLKPYKKPRNPEKHSKIGFNDYYLLVAKEKVGFNFNLIAFQQARKENYQDMVSYVLGKTEVYYP